VFRLTLGGAAKLPGCEKSNHCFRAAGNATAYLVMLCFFNKRLAAAATVPVTRQGSAPDADRNLLCAKPNRLAVSIDARD